MAVGDLHDVERLREDARDVAADVVRVVREQDRTVLQVKEL